MSGYYGRSDNSSTSGTGGLLKVFADLRRWV